jgi:hypothetical protein
MHQSSLNSWTKGKKRGAGVKVLTELRRHTGLAIDTLLGLELEAAHLVRAAALAEKRTPEQQLALDRAAELDRIEQQAAAKSKPKRRTSAPAPKSRPRQILAKA